MLDGMGIRNGGGGLPYDFSGLDVVVADDIARMRAMLVSTLEGFGVTRTREAADGESAWAAICGRAPDLLITDFDMRPLDGAGLTRRIRQAPDSPNRFLPIVMVTAFTDPARLAEARDAGVNEIIHKPASARALRAHMAAVLGNPRPFIHTMSYFGPERRRARGVAAARERRAPAPQG